MQFRIPQFLDIEDQVFGPFTFKQFGYIIGAVAFAYIFWKLIPYVFISLIFILIFSGTFLALAFVKINSRPFADVLESAYKFLIGNKVFIWQKSKNTENKKENLNQKLKEIELKKKEIEAAKYTKTISREQIHNLSDKLNILEEDKKEESLRDHIFKKVGKNII